MIYLDGEHLESKRKQREPEQVDHETSIELERAGGGSGATTEGVSMGGRDNVGYSWFAESYLRN